MLRTLFITIAGTEQHRHNTAEVAVYSIISYLWGLETRGHYAMTKVSEVGVESRDTYNRSTPRVKMESVPMTVTLQAKPSYVRTSFQKFSVRLEAVHKLS